jgi:hypothetical protein
MANAAESWRRVSPHLSPMLLSTAAMHAARAVFVVFAFYQQTAMSYRGINTIRAEN